MGSIGLDFIPADVYMSGHARMTPSSRGLGRYPFKVETRVRNPLGSPFHFTNSKAFLQDSGVGGCPAELIGCQDSNRRRRLPKVSVANWISHDSAPTGFPHSSQRVADAMMYDVAPTVTVSAIL